MKKTGIWTVFTCFFLCFQGFLEPTLSPFIYDLVCFSLALVIIPKNKQINQHHIKNINFDDIRKMSNVVEYEIINKSFENFLSKVLIVL